MFLLLSWLETNQSQYFQGDGSVPGYKGHIIWDNLMISFMRTEKRNSNVQLFRIKHGNKDKYQHHIGLKY